jgi:hypothetical protein
MAKRGEALQFFERALTLETDECIPWPFSRDQVGYGMIHHRRGNTKMRRVHNLMCERVHGLAPPRHEAAHSCNFRPCINKRHIRWDTRKGNMADQIFYGTRFVPSHAKLTTVQVLEIFNSKEPDRPLARRFGVSDSTVWDIRHGRSWSRITGKKPTFVLEHTERDGVARAFEP